MPGCKRCQHGNVCFCNSSEVNCIVIEDLADQIHQVIDNHFYLTSPEPEGFDYHLAREGLWEQPGGPVLDLLQILARIDEELAQAIYEYLSETHDAWGKNALADPLPYDSDAQYEERPINSYEFADSWARFKNEVGSRSRYFNLNASSSLDHIFDGISALETRDGEPVIREFSPDRGAIQNRHELGARLDAQFFAPRPGLMAVPE